jgi:hypothetical protein
VRFDTGSHEDSSKSMKTHEGEKHKIGGLSRYAVFMKRTKSVYIDDPYDTENAKKYKVKKMLFENNTSTSLAYLDKLASLHSYDYSWTNEYDTIYNGLYITKSSVISPIWCVYNYHQFEPLTYYCVNTSHLPEKYDYTFQDYSIL